jgi:hypothetical protein
MDHIVDVKNSLHGYQEQDFMILGNVIMAYSTWNIQVGQLAWESVKLEKREIYGIDIFDAAMEHVMRCASLRSLPTVAPCAPESTQISIPATTERRTYEQEGMLSSSMIIVVGWVTATLTLIVVIGCTILLGHILKKVEESITSEV